MESYRGDGYEAAWGAWIDESPTIPEDEVIEAYGIDGESFVDLASAKLEKPASWFGTEFEVWKSKRDELAKTMLQRADEDARNGHGEYPDLLEGYEYQDNATGTGIVYVGHYAWMNEADPEDIESIPSSMRTTFPTKSRKRPIKCGRTVSMTVSGSNTSESTGANSSTVTRSGIRRKRRGGICSIASADAPSTDMPQSF